MMGKGRLVLFSFLMLFVELALIRWLGSNILYLSYFSNFVLLGSFLGIGIGFLRARSEPNLFPWSAVALAGLVLFVATFPVQINRGSAQVIYFGADPTGLPIWVTLPVIFLMVALVMTAIAQGVARIFVQFEPLQAYRLDILGSLAGIAAFSVLSFLSAPPVVWGAVVAALMLALEMPSIRARDGVALAAVVAVLAIETLNPHFTWSPYYKIGVYDVQPGVKALLVNGIPHQMIESIPIRKELEPAYFVPYRRIRSNPLNDVLIIGAGNGSDVSIALANGAKRVDAVEIDPKIYAIGRAEEPDRPYQDPRVTIHINDGRAYLQQTRKKYDLILFALPDSLILVSGQSSLRLESYLFTTEAMQTAQAHLRPHGAFGMYNYYREPWLVDRLAGELQATYGRRPCIDTAGMAAHFAVLMVSNDPREIDCAGSLWTPGAQREFPPVDDDHPFLYLRTRTIPALYLGPLAAILLLSLLLVRGVAGSLRSMLRDVDLFFMGAAFMLLETKNVVQFALLFGTTWFVNALVFFGILLTVYLAIEVAQRVRARNPSMLYIALFFAIAVAWAIPPAMLLSLGVLPRFVAAAALAFAPIFLANLIFAERFRESSASGISFGANLLGAMVGGVLEYASLIVGYRSLLIIIAALYGLAFVFSRQTAAVGEAAFET
jgi:hypothetical protein